MSNVASPAQTSDADVSLRPPKRYGVVVAVEYALQTGGRDGTCFPLACEHRRIIVSVGDRR